MAKRDAEGVPKKFSSKLLQMKFMQRAAAKTEAEAAPVHKVSHFHLPHPFVPKQGGRTGTHDSL